MIDLEFEKKRFVNHIAEFTDYGNIKIVDFKMHDSGEYRIRKNLVSFWKLHLKNTETGHNGSFYKGQRQKQEAKHSGIAKAMAEQWAGKIN